MPKVYFTGKVNKVYNKGRLTVYRRKSYAGFTYENPWILALWQPL